MTLIQINCRNNYKIRSNSMTLMNLIFHLYLYFHFVIQLYSQNKIQINKLIKERQTRTNFTTHVMKKLFLNSRLP